MIPEGFTETTMPVRRPTGHPGEYIVGEITVWKHECGMKILPAQDNADYHMQVVHS